MIIPRPHVMAAGLVIALSPLARARIVAPVRNVAHRGASFRAPENTMAAFREAIERGADWIESDVQRTRDGALVLMHDTTLSRTTNVDEVFPDRAPWRVADLSLAQIKRLDAGSWKGARFAGEPVPTLAELIALARRSGTGLLVEIKTPELYPGIEADVAALLDGLPGRLAVESFDWDCMRRYRRIQPEVPVGLLGTPTRGQLPRLAWADQINPHHRTFDTAYVDRVHALGMEVHAWTVDPRADMREVLDRGVDGVITNKPGLLDAVLAERRLPQAA